MRTIVDHAEMMRQATALLTELVDSLALLRWSKLAPPPDHQEAVFYQGIGAGWIVTVGSWPFEPSPEGREPERGYDGTCAKAGTIVHLTREVAEKVFLYAEKMTREEGENT